MILYNRELKNYQFNIRKHKSHNKNKNGEYKTVYYCDDIFTFDIETTSAWLKDNNVIGYEKGYDSDYWNSLEPLAIPYIWQFSVNDIVYYGREFKDFLKLLEDLPNAEIIIWVHNLSFEFQFLRNILPQWKNIFARTAHKPIKATPLKYENITFRCTYILTRLSLACWGKQIGFNKKQVI